MSLAGVNTSGTIVNAQEYYAYGNLIASYNSNPNDKYKFTGKERDTETNYDYFGARYYDSELGRWMSVDPLAAKYPGWSTYNYALGNPLILVDDDGREVKYRFDGNVLNAFRFASNISKLRGTDDGRRLYNKLNIPGPVFEFQFGSLSRKTNVGHTDLHISEITKTYKSGKKEIQKLLTGGTTTIDIEKISELYSDQTVEGIIGHEMLHISEAIDDIDKYLEDYRKEHDQFPDPNDANKREQERRANIIQNRINKEIGVLKGVIVK